MLHQPPAPISPTQSGAPATWSYVRAQQWNASEALACGGFWDVFGQKNGGRGLGPPATEYLPTQTAEQPAEPTVAKPAGRGKHPRRRGPSGRYVTLATDGQEILGPGGFRRPCVGSDVHELAAVAREAGAGAVIVFVHPAAHDGWALPAYNRNEPLPFLAGARQVGCGTFVVDGHQQVFFSLTAWCGDFAAAADAAELLAAVEAFRDAIGFNYLFSGPSTAHQLIKLSCRIGVPDPEPELEPAYAKAAYAVPAYTWSRPLTEREGARGWIRAFDRGGSYLAAWQGCTLSDGPWTELGPVTIEPGRETDRPAGYWLAADATRAAVAAAAAHRGLPDPTARWGDPGAALWLSTPLLALLVDPSLPGGPLMGQVDVARAWVAERRARPLDGPVKVLGAAREHLADAGPPGALALKVLKNCYSGGTAWLEHGAHPGDELYRPHWYRTIVDRHCANTFRALAKAEPGPFALAGVDCALFALDGPDDAPAGLRLGRTLGAWKPKGPALPMTNVADALGRIGG